jgi:hypothetical protein
MFQNKFPRPCSPAATYGRGPGECRLCPHRSSRNSRVGARPIPSPQRRQMLCPVSSLVTFPARNPYYWRGLFTLMDSKGLAVMDRKICKIFVGHNSTLRLNLPPPSGFFALLSSQPRRVAGAQSNSDYLPFLFALCYFAFQPQRRASLATKPLRFCHIQWISNRGLLPHDGTSQTRSLYPVR